MTDLTLKITRPKADLTLRMLPGSSSPGGGGTGVTQGDIDDSIDAHSAAADPHGDRAYTDGVVAGIEGAVDSVNGQTGTVVLDASDVGADPAGSAAAVTTTSIGAVPTSRTVSAGTGLTGGGDLSTDRTLAVSFGTTAGTVAAGDDARIAGAAPLASPTFTGTPAAPTAAVGTSTTQIATTAFVQALDGAPTAKVTGLYYAPVGITSGGQLSPFTAAGVMAATPIFLWAGTYTGVGNAYYYGTGTATIRLGLYNRTGTAGLPGSLVSGGDFGTFTCTAGAAGAKEISISFTLATSGWYWIAGLCDAYTSTPDFVGFSNTNAHGPIPLPGFPATGDTNNASCITRTGVTTGSMPSSFGTPSNYAGTRFPAFRMYLSS